MRLFIAREALDPHLKVGGAIFNTQLPMSDADQSRCSAPARFTRAGIRGSGSQTGAGKIDQAARAHLRAMSITPRATSKRLARGLFHAMMRFGPKLDREQLLLSRFVGVATEIFAMSATCSYAQHLIDQGKPAEEILSVAHYFCRSARMRIDHHFAGTAQNADKRGYELVQELLAGKHEELRRALCSTGILRVSQRASRPPNRSLESGQDAGSHRQEACAPLTPLAPQLRSA